MHVPRDFTLGLASNLKNYDVGPTRLGSLWKGFQTHDKQTRLAKDTVLTYLYSTRPKNENKNHGDIASNRVGQTPEEDKALAHTYTYIFAHNKKDRAKHHDLGQNQTNTKTIR